MRRYIILLTLFLSSQMVFSWGQNGHRIVAQICFDNLSDYAKQCIQDAIGDNYLTQIATWPDFIRSEENWDFTKPWHYITVKVDQTVEQALQKSSKNDSIDNVIEAIRLMRDIISNDANAKSRFQKLMDDNDVKPLSGSIEATAIAFLIHFIGDIHQPLHVGKGDDLGGNKVYVQFFSEATNLHSVWDEGIIEKEQLSFTEFSKFVNKRYETKVEDFQKASIITWAKESVAARDIIYKSVCDNQKEAPCLSNFSYQYQHDSLPIIQKRLAAAGFRAAGVFDSVFKK